MTKSIQSVCKRTRSKSKQTSLLDFDSKKSRGRSATAPAAATASNANQERRSTTASKRTKSTANQSLRQGTTTRKAEPSNANDDGNLEVHPKPASNKRRRVGKPAAAAANPAASPTETEEQSHHWHHPPAAASASNDGPAEKKRAAVCYDVTTAAKLTVKAMVKQPKESSSPADETAGKQQSVTPSPGLMARKEAAEKNAMALDLDSSSSSDSAIGNDSSSDDGNSSDGSNDGQNEEQTMESSTPLIKEAEERKGGSDTSSEHVLKATSSDNGLLPVHRSVTIDPLGESQTKVPHQSRSRQQLVPAFHHPWQQPYTPALSHHHSPNTLASNPTTLQSNSLPTGVIDIDTIPHKCCLASLQSHGGYSWITSRRRCACAKDSNHNSSESMSEAYLGRYGVDRYGEVGFAGLKDEGGMGASGEMNGCDWKTERWWLDQRRMEMGGNARSGQNGALKSLENITRMDDDNMKSMKKKSKSGKGDNDEEDSRTPSPTSTLSDASSISETCSTKLGSQQLASLLLPTSVEKHLDYMSRQPHITIEMRRILMDWLVEVAEEYKLNTETFWSSVNLVDRALACSYAAVEMNDGGKKKKNKKGEGKSQGVGADMVVSKDDIQLVGCACTLMASKLHEITPPTAEDFVYISDKTYTRKEILDMEATICNALKFNLNFVTPYQYVDRFLRASYASSESSTLLSSTMNGAVSGANNATNVLMKKLVFYLLDLAVLEYKLVSKKPSLVAAAAVYLARATLGVREPPSKPFQSSYSPALQRALNGFWSKTLEYYTGYDIWDLEECVRLLHRLQENAEDSHLTSIFSKHKGIKCKRVALKTVVNEEELGFL